jgi:anthranilate synthase component II
MGAVSATGGLTMASGFVADASATGAGVTASGFTAGGATSATGAVAAASGTCAGAATFGTGAASIAGATAAVPPGTGASCDTTPNPSTPTIAPQIAPNKNLRMPATLAYRSPIKNPRWRPFLLTLPCGSAHLYRDMRPHSPPNRQGAPKMLLLIDNYDSFTYNLVHYLGELGADVRVVRNDALDVQAAMALRPTAIVLSPGPCDPSSAGICLPLTLAAAEARIPLLGVCLGHQTIGQAFGGDVVRCHEIVHGKMGVMHHAGKGVFAGLPSPFVATRYHSLVVDPKTLPDCLEVTAWLEDGTIMGLRHKDRPIEGVQFHPESIASEHGHQLLRNFLNMAQVPA